MLLLYRKRTPLAMAKWVRLQARAPGRSGPRALLLARIKGLTVPGAVSLSSKGCESDQLVVVSSAHASRLALPFAPSLPSGLAGLHGKADPRPPAGQAKKPPRKRSEEHTSELQS